MSAKTNTKPNNSTNPITKKINPKILLALAFIFSILASHNYLNNKMLASAISTIATCYTTHLATQSKEKQKKINPHIIRTTNRLKDIIIFTGITLNPHIPTNIALITLASIALFPHLTEHIQSLSKNNIIPPISRTHTYTILIASTLAEILTKNILGYALIIISALTIYSFTHTLTNALKTKNVNRQNKPH